MIHPSFISILAALLAIRWGIKFYHKHEWRNLFTCLAYVYFTSIYFYISSISPTTEDMRALIRVGLAVLFGDELVNWLAYPFFGVITKLWGKR